MSIPLLVFYSYTIICLIFAIYYFWKDDDLSSLFEEVFSPAEENIYMSILISFIASLICIIVFFIALRLGI